MNANIPKTVNPLKNPLKGTIKVPADKSISHRAAIFAALTRKEVLIGNFSLGADCKSTLSVLEQLGVEINFQSENNLSVLNKKGFKEPKNILYAGNSGTTIRLMAGILATSSFTSSITGDESLKKRPMGRIINPLKQMGANISAEDNDTKAPIIIKGSKLKGIMHNSQISSAQVKSCILLAGLNAEGKTIFREPVKSRDHTERLLAYLGADIEVEDTKVKIKQSELQSKPISIPGDISSAAFFIVAACIIPDSEIVIEGIGLNPTRTGIIDVMKQMGAKITILNQRIECNEEIGDIKINYSKLKGITIGKEMIPAIIDELPIIAVAATQAEGTTIVKEAEELRHKESDRIKAVCLNLKKLGADIEEALDGFVVHGKTQLRGNCVLETYHDHRIAMTGYVAGLASLKPVKINEFNWVNISFPEFTDIFAKIIH
ncbi:MAG TPA: 3-phosphoshikimate 1-carboxyvinyltransferase [Candidatus Gastranaerophilales bacterium]|nr:3-phosphoshikimate 1-carboxyvinyltransferase [Candidatus Gastranaerophilales bacterium]